ncbi:MULTISPECIES: LysR family transcriptional regulator [unclassified Gordonia (in: high G+C Gram-positive bacteria)]|uniref:LysR family transcriptional regulator n=1 Tax=unclassified Gordonia (in: high G+C Gram-positive bacteria) TaxID=2657482 RepID=UPI001F10B80B|nr:LysR family transcriptional regulator [Gordonia sp. ABSL49_1]MCH5641244.1 LysR family transcriptional regulator [Gordonia sp. ABSL49_1]
MTDPMMLDSRRLRNFVVAAESDTLSRAAQNLFLTQQALSASVRQLERELNTPLFDRSHRHWVLTESGKVLYEGAKAILAGNAALVRSVQSVATGRPTPFVVGHSPAISGEEVYRLLRPIIAAEPEQPITVRQLFPGDLREELLSNDIDVALRRGVDAPEALMSSVFAYHELRLAVHVEHPLAGERQIAAQALATTPIVVWAPERHSFYTDLLVSYCRRSGFEPSLIINNVQGTPPFTAVLRHRSAAAFVTDAAGELAGGSIRVIDFDEPPLVPVQAIWLPHSHSALRSAMIDGGSRV